MIIRNPIDKTVLHIVLEVGQKIRQSDTFVFDWEQRVEGEMMIYMSGSEHMPSAAPQQHQACPGWQSDQRSHLTSHLIPHPLLLLDTPGRKSFFYDLAEVVLLILSGVPPVWVCWPQSVAVMTRTVCCAVCSVQSRPPPRHHRHCQHSVSRETGGGRGRTELWSAEHQDISGLIFTATEYAVPDLDNIQTGRGRGQHSPPLSLSLSHLLNLNFKIWKD